MKNIIVGTTTGAIFGAAISMIIPCKKNSSIKNNFMKKGKKLRSRLIKKVASVVYKII